MPLHLNDKAPNIILNSTSGRTFNLYEDAKGKSVVIYFYPKDFTPGCTAEACEFRDTYSFFNGLEIPVYGISKDSVESHLKFKQTYQLPFELLSDTDGSVSKLYKAQIPILNLVRRITYLLDANHRIAAVYENFFEASKHIREMVKKVKVAANE